MSRYAATYANLRGAGDARPTAMQIVNDEGFVGKFTDKVMIITGGYAGIGAETARAFHATGAKLAAIILIKMELGSLDSVREGVKELLGKTDRLNLLVNNAGEMATPDGRTRDKFETTRAFQSRVVFVSPIAHRYSPVRFDDYNFDEPSSYNEWRAYGLSKACVIHLANEIEKQYSSQGLHATSLHPSAFKSNLQAPVHETWNASVSEVPELKASATTVYATLSWAWEGKGGLFLSNRAVMGVYRGKPPTGPEDDDFKDAVYLPRVYDAASEGRLWKNSLKMVGLEDDQRI